MGSKAKRPMVIDLVDSSDDEGQGTPPAKQGGSAKLPMHPASPPSHATTSSRDALAELLKGSTRPPLPPRGRASKPRAKSTAPKPAAGAEGKRRKADGEPNGGVGRTAGTAHPSGQPAHGSSEELWAVKHAPASEADMVVHKKKIEDVKAWLQPHASGTAVRGSKMVVVTGPPGCGKTATIHVLSQAMGFRVVEWQAQAQVSWDDVQYQRPDGVHYQGQDSVQYHSKLALFEDFASRAKVAALPLAIASRAPQEEELSSRAGAAALTNGAVTNPVMPALPPTLVLIDDLPYTSGIDQRQRLSQTLGDLARCARFPVVLIATEPSGRAQKERGNIGAAVSGPTGLHKDICDAVAAAGARSIPFNPITKLNIEKALNRVLAIEGYKLPSEHIGAIAEHADGDLRNALSTLQFVCTGKAKAAVVAQPPSKRRRGKAATAGAPSAAAGGSKGPQSPPDVKQVSFMMRDTSLSTFHGLGKLLYNKRLAPSEENEGNVRGGSNRSDPNIKLNVAAWAQRNPMDGFDPERVLEAAGLDAGSVAAFLHENLCSFVENSAIEDLAGCLDEISASDVLAAGTRRRGDAADGSLDDGGAAVAASAAGSVAARGVCFWNSHPAPRSFHPLKKPELFTVQRLMASNAEQLELAASAGRVLHGGSGGLESKVAVAAELMPYLRCICHPASGHAPADLIMQLPAVWKHWSNGTVHEYRAHAGAMQNGGAAEGRGELGGSGVLETIEDPDDW